MSSSNNKQEEATILSSDMNMHQVSLLTQMTEDVNVLFFDRLPP